MLTSTESKLVTNLVPSLALVTSLPCWFVIFWHESRQEGHGATDTHRNELRRPGNIPMSASLFHIAGSESDQQTEKDKKNVLRMFGTFLLYT